ncbi:Phosphatidylinositol-4-phosphate 5-kinase [Mucor circinelloides]
MSIDILPQTPPPTSTKERLSSYTSSSFVADNDSTNKQEVNPHYINNQPALVSDNKTQPTAVILKKVIKKPPPLFIDVQQDAQNNTPLKRTIKSPSSSVRLMDLGPLDNDEQHVLEEEIKARRLARRQKTYADDRDEDEQDDTVVTIGTRVAEGHRNYQMMYDMLTGIRIAVGRVSAKIARPLTTDDFTAAHKLVFDITGNELTPGVKYDFKFKDYAPWVFRNLREKFHVDAADYMMSLTNKYILSEIGSPGKSGSFFYYSRDYRFIIKTIHHGEHKFMRKILKEYYEHVANNPNTLLCRFYGLHRIKLPRGRKIHFVVMGNVLPSNKDIHKTFDLKGSLFGRLTSDEEVAKNPHAVMKDQNWVKNKEQIQLGPAKRALFLTQLERDVEILKRLNIMDYSLLVGVHDIKKGNTECIRDQSLHMVTPRTDKMERRSSTVKRTKTEKAEIVRKALRNANPVHIDTSELPASPSEERRWCIFYADDGGFRSSDEEDRPSDKLYYVGIIDILTPYNIVKRSEHIWKSITQDKDTISSVHPLVYGKRFMDFMVKAVNGTFNSSLSLNRIQDTKKNH